MKRLFTLAVLLSTPLAWQCFASESGYDFVDSEEKKFYLAGNVSVLGVPYYKDESVRDHVRGSFIGGYNYAENIKIELEIMFGSPGQDVYDGTLLANVRYSHKTKDSQIAPYFGIGIGISRYWGARHVMHPDVTNKFAILTSKYLANQVKIGAEYQITPKISISGGCRFISSIALDERYFDISYNSGWSITSYGLEVGISYNF